MNIGIIRNGGVCASDDWEINLYTITSRIRQRIADLEH